VSTTRTFNTLLNDYLTPELFSEELIKRDFVLNKVEKVTDWKGGDYVVPFRGAQASSVTFNALTGSTDIAESTYVRGTVSTAKELWGSLIFNHRDLQEHDGKIPESTFLKILPDEIEMFMDYLRQVTSVALTSGPHFATATTSGTNVGVVIVDKVDRFQISQKVSLVDDDTAAASYYVITINLNTKAVTLSATRGGSAADVSAYTTGQNAKFYHPGVASSSDTFISLRQALLSSTNGGASSLHGSTKTAYPILQAFNYSGASMNATNVLDTIFDAYTNHRAVARGNVTDVIMSYKHLGSVFKALEVQKGGYRVTKDAKANMYGWTEITIGSVKGELTLVGIQEMDDDVIFGIDWSSMKFISNGLFKKRVAPDGKMYFEVRNTSGYQYIVDVALWGEMTYPKPSSNFAIYSIPSYT
jgi:hypothetical protein